MLRKNARLGRNARCIMRGFDGQGRRIRPKAPIDPGSGKGIRDWNRAIELVRELELPRPTENAASPGVPIDEAAAAFPVSKAKRSPDRQRKIRLLTSRLTA